MRAVVDPFLLKVFYELWQQMSSSEEEIVLDFSFRIEKEGIAFMTRFVDEAIHSALFEGVKMLEMSSSKWVYYSMKKRTVSFVGFLLLGVELSKGERFLDYIQGLQNQFCFLKN